MAKKQRFTQPTEIRKRRRFSEEFKRQKVQEIQAKITTIAQVSKQFQVRRSCVDLWLNKYGTPNPYKGVRLIVESESNTQTIARLEAKIAELERLVGQKEVMVNFMNKVIDTAENMYQVDIKKKLGVPPSPSVSFKKTGAGPKA